MAEALGFFGAAFGLGGVAVADATAPPGTATVWPEPTGFFPSAVPVFLVEAGVVVADPVGPATSPGFGAVPVPAGAFGLAGVGEGLAAGTPVDVDPADEPP